MRLLSPRPPASHASHPGFPMLVHGTITSALYSVRKAQMRCRPAKALRENREAPLNPDRASRRSRHKMP